jgi:hypothetical protein
MLFRKAVLYAIALALVLSGASAPPAHAIDFYEIQIYSTETDPLGHLQLELHSNSVTTATGTEAHQQIVPYQIHETVEATYGILPWAEIGQYFATARLDNGNYEYAGSRSKFHFGVPQTADWPVSLGGTLELDYMRRAAEENPLTLEMRPIAETHLGKFTLIGNFAFEKPFSGPGTHKGVTFEPSGEAEYEKLLWWLSPAVEYYGDMGAVSDLPGVQHQQHFIVPALNFDFLDQLELNLGVGFGLTQTSNGTFVKSIVGWTF